MIAAPHVSKFRWEDQGAVCRLFDGNEQVFRFNRENLTLRDARLLPVGYPLIEGPQATFASAWPAAWGSHQTLKHQTLKSLEANDGDPEKFALRVVSDGESALGESEWFLTIHYDAERESYVYDVDMTLTVSRTKAEIEPAYNAWTQFQYYDLYASGMADPKVLPYAVDPKDREFDRPLWDWFAYEDEDYYGYSRRWIKIPLNRFIARNCCGIRLKRDGRIGLFAAEIGNPVIQLLGDTAAVSALHQCNMLYDLHFIHFFGRCQEPPPVGTKVNAKFAIFNFSQRQAEDILKIAVSAPVLNDEREAKRYPRYEENARNSFAAAIALDVPDHSRVWKPFVGNLAGRGSDEAIVLMDIRAWRQGDVTCEWDRTVGHSDRCSLKVRSTVENGVGGWGLLYFDSLDFEPEKRYELSCFVRTENLRGKGATLGYVSAKDNSYCAPIKADLAPVLAENARLRGTNDWTRIALVTPPLEEVPNWSLNGEWKRRKLLVALWHEGLGTTWFDDFEFKSL